MFATLVAVSLSLLGDQVKTQVDQVVGNLTGYYHFTQCSNTLDQYAKDFFGAANAPAQKALYNQKLNNLLTKSLWDNLAGRFDLSKSSYCSQWTNKSTLVKDIIGNYITRDTVNNIAANLDQYVELYSGLLRASNLDIGRYTATIKALSQQWDTYTLGSWLNQVGIDYDVIYAFVNHLHDVLIPGTNYDIFTLLKNEFYKPTSKLDDLIAQLKFIIIDGHMCWNAVERLIDIFIEMTQTFARSLFLKLCHLLNAFAGPIRPLVDLSSKSLPFRVDEASNNLQRLINYPPTSKVKDYIGQAKAKQVFDLLLQFKEAGVGLANALRVIGISFNGITTEELFSTFSKLISDTDSILTVFAKYAHESDYGKLNKYIINLINLAQLPDTKIKSLLPKETDLPERYLTKAQKYINDFINMASTLGTTPISNIPIFGPYGFNNANRVTTNLKDFIKLLNNINSAMPNTKYYELLRMNKQSLLNRAKEINQVDLSSSYTTLDLLCQIIPSTYITKKDLQSLINNLQTFSKRFEESLNKYQIYIPIIIYNKFTSFNNQLYDLCTSINSTKVKISKLPEKVQYFIKLEKAVYNGMTGDETIQEIFNKVDHNFLNIPATLNAINTKFSTFGDDTLTLNNLYDCIIIGDTTSSKHISASTYSIFDYIPMKSWHQRALNLVNTDEMNISLVAENLLGAKPSELTQTLFRISKIIGSSNYSLINIIDKYVGVNIKFGAEKLSQQMHLASLGMFVNVFDLNDAIIEFNQVIQDVIDASVAQAAAEDEAGKKGLSTPAIAGITFGCIFVVFIAVVVGLSFHIYFRKEKTQLLLPDEDNAIP